MPHTGTMNDYSRSDVEGLLTRARRHLKTGKLRLSQGKISLGIITLYDAVTHGMQWYIAHPEHAHKFSFNKGEDTQDDAVINTVLTRSGILDGSFDYAAMNSIVEKALYQDMSAYDYTDMVRGIEKVLTQLGVMPFDDDPTGSGRPEIV